MKKSKSLFVNLLMSIGVLLVTIGVSCLTSCRSTRYIPMPSSHTRDSTHLTSDHRYDSIYIDRWHTLQLTRGTPQETETTDQGQSPIGSFRIDTMVVRDSIYVEKWRIRARADTVRIVIRDSVPYPVEVPVEVEKPIPRGQRLIRDTTYRFLVRCTIGLFALIVFAIIALVARFYLRR